MLYLGWIAAAFLGGYLLAEALRKKRASLRENFSRVDSFRGRSYHEVLSLAGAQPCTVIQRADGGTQRIWRQENYSITLLFDAQDRCLGVTEENI